MSYPTAYRTAGARARAGGLSVPVRSASQPSSQFRAPTISRGYAPTRLASAGSGRLGWRPPAAANSNSLALARLAASLGVALRVGRLLTPIGLLLTGLLEAYRLAQSRWSETAPGSLSYAGFVETHVCNFANTGGPDKRGGPGSCLSGQASPGPLSAGDPIQGAEWNNGFSVYGLITTLSFARWNMIASYAPIWQDTGIWNEDPKIPQFPPTLFPPFVDPMVQAPFSTEPVPFDPPLWMVRLRDRARSEPDPEGTTRGEPGVADPTPWDFTWVDPSLPGIWLPLAPPSLPAPPAVPVRPGRVRRPPGERPEEAPDGEPETPSPRPEWPAAIRPGELVIDQRGERLRPSQHRNRKPRSNEREKKVVVAATRTIAGRVFGAVTEAGDAVDAVYDALPEKLRRRERAKRHGRDPRLQTKLRILWENWEEVDVVEAINNLALNHLQDYAIGQANRRTQRALTEAGWRRPVGFQAGNTLGYRPEGFHGISAG